jgi:sugar phosphate permease
MRRLRWTAFTLVAVAYMLAFFHRIAPAAIAPELARAFNTSGAALGALAASYFYVHTLMQIPIGVMVDTLDPRRIAAIGSIIGGAGSVVFALASTFGAASLGRLAVGFGVSGAFLALLKISAAWFHDREFATITGFTLSLGNLGAVLSAAPLAWIVAVVEWRTVFVALGVLSLLIGIFTWLVVRDDPRAAGLPSMRELDGLASQPKHEDHWLEGLSAVMKNRASWPGFWLNLGLGGGFIAFAGLWAVPYLVDVHWMTKTVATYHTSAMLLGFALGSWAIGAWSDRLGRRKPLLLAASTLFTLCWIPMIAGVAMPLALSLVLFTAMGLCAGGFTLTWALVKEVNPHALSGMATSLVNTGIFLGAAIYQPLIGWVLDRASAGRGAYAMYDYRYALGVLLLFSAAGVCAATYLKEEPA